MDLYRARPQDGVVWVTGASSGIGRAVALKLAQRGFTVVATARREEALSRLAEEAASLRGSIVPMPGDVTDETGMANIMASIEARHTRLALCVFNAGVFLPVHGERLTVDRFEKTFDVNLLGVIKGLVPAAAHMHRKGGGQIAIVASVTGYFGLPTSAAYGASKAALINLAESLKFDFDKMNIRIQVVDPGFVDTPATEGNPFPMPALIEPEDAAERLVKGLERGGFEITFPRRFTWFLKVLQKLPYLIFFSLVSRGTGWNDKPLRPRSSSGGAEAPQDEGRRQKEAASGGVSHRSD
ncbi:SDR family NAD(P)-dependent oxidoreductase [Pseudohoeflea coraliihabitans]|uniref:SDR family NAD(P)-dependent oxidoreductase n=1 Tax=Pseudohoeflea coraliihabitans TaxID=2860393 RepID=A0ABS6WRQ9_9HYPH|nr:SDR family NAD(P)-dependent oxidoreductase [Pseudohoeflea sp. DP4N28-3]MBW3098097.1 SDR family NAD(P)-dependent oxidoreductase [Pseudohoeflea sp. DP4N28-3]